MYVVWIKVKTYVRINKYIYTYVCTYTYINLYEYIFNMLIQKVFNHSMCSKLAKSSPILVTSYSDYFCSLYILDTLTIQAI